jgi:hypothetical protein
MKLISKRMKAIFNQNNKPRFLCQTLAPKQCDTPQQKWVLKIRGKRYKTIQYKSHIF